MRFYETSKKEHTQTCTSFAKLEVFSDFKRLAIDIAYREIIKIVSECLIKLN